MSFLVRRLTRAPAPEGPETPCFAYPPGALLLSERLRNRLGCHVGTEHTPRAVNLSCPGVSVSGPAEPADRVFPATDGTCLPHPARKTGRRPPAIHLVIPPDHFAAAAVAIFLAFERPTRIEARTRTVPLFAPGTAPFTRIRFCSPSIRTTSWQRLVTRSSPM